MQRCSFFRFAFLALALLAVLAPNLVAQTTTASLAGTVLDTTAAVVPKANVQLKNEANGDLRRTVSNSDGYFAFAAVVPGSYTVSVELQGFNRWEQTGVILTAGDKRIIANVILKVGTAKETVTVEASSQPITPVDSGEKSTLINEKVMNNVAIVGQNAAEFIKIMPGMAMTGGLVNQASYSASDERTGNGPVQNFSPNGLRVAALDITSDGAHIVDPGCNCGQSMNTNVDMTAELKVQSSNFGADASKGPVVITAIGKSGGQKFHGEAYVYNRNYALNANDWLNNAAGLGGDLQPVAARPATRYWYPGAQIGGPVYIPGTNFNKNHDKLFFFFAFQYYKQDVDNGIYHAVVPTQAMRNGDYSNATYLSSLNGSGVTSQLISSYPGSILPSTAISKNGQALMNSYPLPNVNPALNQGFNYINSQTRFSNMQQYRPRIDYNINDNTKLYITYNRQRDNAEESLDTLWTGNGQSWASPTVPYPTPIIESTQSDTVSANLTRVFSPTLTNELVFTYTYLNLPNHFQDPTKVQRGSLGLDYKMLFNHANQDKLILPEMTGWGDGIANVLNAGFELNGTVYAKKTLPTIADNVSKVWGTHTAKFGFYWERTFNEQPGNADVNGQGVYATWGGNSVGNVYADVLTGHMQSYNETNFNTVPAFRYTSVDFYGTDSWKVTRRLTLEYGLRAQHLGPWVDTTGYGFAVWNQSQYSNNPADVAKLTGLQWHKITPGVPLSGSSTRFLFFNPRFGFAYDLFGTGKTVLRGGYGIYHYHDEQNVQNGAYAITQGSYSYTTPVAVTYEDLATQSAAFAPPGGVTALDPKDDQQPRTQSYSFTVQQRTPWSSVLEVAYVGNKADYLSNYNNNIGTLNLLPVGALFQAAGWANTYNTNQYRPMVNYQTVKIINHQMYSNYNALQTSWNKQAGHMNIMANYTFSKALGIRGENGATVGDPTSFHNLYGTLPNNRTHIFNAAYVYQVPDLAKSSNKFAKGLANGWQVSGILQYQSGADLQASGSSAAFNFSGWIPVGTKFMGQTIGTGPSDQVQMSNQNMIGTPDITLMPSVVCDPRSNLGPQQHINGSCFAPPTIGSNGNYIFPTLTGPGFFNTDLTLYKSFTWGESQSKKLRFQFSGYNFLNHPNWTFISGDPNLNLTFSQAGQLTNPNFGITTNKTGHRIMQLAVKFSF